MQLEKVLLLTFEGDAESRTEVQSMLRTARDGEFQFQEEILPVTGANHSELTLPALLARHTPSVLVLGVLASARAQAERILQLLREHSGHVPVMVLPGSSPPEEVLALLELGARDFAVPPLRAQDFLPRLRRMLPARKGQAAEANVSNKRKEQPGLGQIIGESARLTEAVQLLPKLARREASVFITGETGTGKEMFARALHHLSARASRPFIAVNCGAIPAELVENELFGHERGAFTGANASARGLIHDADGGTLFLDEIDSLPLPMQVKLLRFLQDRTYRALGGREVCQADVRVVAASNTDLEAAVKAGKFRSDLFYRINVLTLQLPPLRDRQGDIPALARHFVQKYAREFSRGELEISPAALQKLTCYEWPGNVRELENIIQRAVALCDQPAIQCLDIVLPVADFLESASFKALKARVVLNFEKDYLQRLLASHEGNISRAARAASKDRRAFWQLLRKHQLHLPSSPARHSSSPGNLRLC